MRYDVVSALLKMILNTELKAFSFSQIANVNGFYDLSYVDSKQL